MRSLLPRADQLLGVAFDVIHPSDVSERHPGQCSEYLGLKRRFFGGNDRRVSGLAGS